MLEYQLMILRIHGNTAPSELGMTLFSPNVWFRRGVRVNSPKGRPLLGRRQRRAVEATTEHFHSARGDDCAPTHTG